MSSKFRTFTVFVIRDIETIWIWGPLSFLSIE